MDDLIFGTKEASKEIGISFRTLCRYLNREDFPKPVREQNLANGGLLRWWEKKDLLKFKEKIEKEISQKQKGKGRPLRIKNGNSNAKMTE